MCASANSAFTQSCKKNRNSSLTQSKTTFQTNWSNYFVIFTESAVWFYWILLYWKVLYFVHSYALLCTHMYLNSVKVLLYIMDFYYINTSVSGYFMTKSSLECNHVCAKYLYEFWNAIIVEIYLLLILIEASNLGLMQKYIFLPFFSNSYQ